MSHAVCVIVLASQAHDMEKSVTTNGTTIIVVISYQ